MAEFSQKQLEQLNEIFGTPLNKRFDELSQCVDELSQRIGELSQQIGAVNERQIRQEIIRDQARDHQMFAPGHPQHPKSPEDTR